jgi:ArsR family transcriptional regulator, arsenate/arsenite/antimonite-responsive transcriptional repressor
MITVTRTDQEAIREADLCCGVTPIPVKTEKLPGSVKTLAALADPTRLKIVAMLAGLDEPLCVCDIVAQFELGQPTISHHLKVLRDTGLVTWEKRGLWVYYSLNRDALGQVTSYLGELVNQ